MESVKGIRSTLLLKKIVDLHELAMKSYANGVDKNLISNLCKFVSKN